jgi:hypothetical protein
MEAARMTQLEDLRWQQRLVERMGCIRASLVYLGAQTSFAWLYGGTGQAFITNIDPGVDVSSKDSWDREALYINAPKLGFAVEGFCVSQEKAGETFPQRQREAWDFVRSNIDRGVPCFGFELKANYGGYWVIYGYDDGDGDAPAGYYYSGWEEGGPLPWQELGDQFIPFLEVRAVRRCEPASDDEVVRGGIDVALRHAADSDGWMEPQARAGDAAFAAWARALESGEAKRDHHTYNAQICLECREMAVAYLAEVKARLPGRCDTHCDAAAAHYWAMCERLRELIALHPPRQEPDWQSQFASGEGATLVRQIGALDHAGRAVLAQIAQALR